MTTIEILWRPIVSLSTEDGKDVELRLPSGSVEIGHWSPTEQRWMTACGPLASGVYPTHWRPIEL